MSTEQLFKIGQTSVNKASGAINKLEDFLKTAPASKSTAVVGDQSSGIAKSEMQREIEAALA